MKQKVIAIFFCAVLFMLSISAKADSFQHALQNIEAEWARIYYTEAKEQRDRDFKLLLDTVDAFLTQYPGRAEIIIQQAIIVASSADDMDAFAALQAVNHAKELLLKAIAINPAASDGAAYVALGSLYYKVPGWPLAFGDDDKAEEMLQKALSINAKTIEANYYYADFLVTQGKIQQAVDYFRRALTIPVRKTQVLADTQLHKQAKLALEQTVKLARSP